MKFFVMLRVGIICTIGLVQFSNAQRISPKLVDTYLDGLTKDANQYAKFYISPMLKGLGNGFGNGWYNTARPHESLGFDLSFNISGALVPTIDQNFDFIPANYVVLDETDDPSMTNVFPTVMGGNTGNEVRFYLSKNDANPLVASLYSQHTILSGIQEEIPLFTAVPAPIIQAAVGIYKKTDLKIRWFPSIPINNNFKYKYFGLGVMHNISQWIPAVKNLTYLDISGFIGFTNINLTYILDKNTDTNPLNDQTANLGINTITYDIIGSATFGVFTGFLGLGFHHFKSSFSMNGTYKVDFFGAKDLNGNPLSANITDPLTLNMAAKGFKTTIGARVKLAIFTLYGSYTLQNYNTLNIGIGFSFR